MRRSIRYILFVLMSGLATLAASPSVTADAPITIGVLNDQSGVFSDVTGEGSVIAAQLAIDDFGGSVLGRPIKLLSADHQNKAEVAGTLARRWIDVDDVQAIFDGGSSGAALAIQDIVRQKQRIVVFSGPASSDLTGKACSPFGFHWTYDTYALANTLAKALVAQGADTWFFLTTDYTFGHALERDATGFIERAGGKVIGRVRHPLNTADFSSYILQAQSSSAKIIGLANSGDDALNAIKQAAEFGVTSRGQRLGGLVLLINQIHGLGLSAAAGTMVVESFYWDMNDATRAFSSRFEAKARKKPNMVHAGVYGAVTHYLKSIKQASALDAKVVAKTMKSLPVNDLMSVNVKIREDGRVLRDMHLFQVKTPKESKGPWDYYTLLSTIKGEDAFRSLADGGCKLSAD